MKTFFICVAVVGSLCSNVALADSQKMNAVLDALSNAENGAEIAQGLVGIGKSLNTMTIDDTIALRTGLQLFVNSAVIAENTPEWNMLQVLWEATLRHLVTKCRLEPIEENTIKVYTHLGPPYNLC